MKKSIMKAAYQNIRESVAKLSDIRRSDINLTSWLLHATQMHALHGILPSDILMY